MHRLNSENFDLHLPLVDDATERGPHRLGTRASGVAFESQPELQRMIEAIVTEAKHVRKAL